MILVPLLMFPLMGAAVNLSSESVRSSTSSVTFGVMNLDGGNYSRLAISYFSALPNVTVRDIQPQTVDSAIEQAVKENASSLVVIPANFSSSVDLRQQATFDTYTAISSFGIGETARSSAVSSTVNSFGDYLSAYYIQNASSGLDPAVVMHPLLVNDSTYLNGKLIAVPPSVVGSVAFGQSFTLPFATFVIIIFAMQVASAAMGVEKEQKTLETLLTLPVSRFQILASKLIGSTVIAGLGAITTMVGFTSYMSSIGTLTSGNTTVTIDISPPLPFYVILGGLVFLTIALATTFAIIISVFTADVRSAQAVVGYLSIPIMLPALMTVVGDFNTFSLPLKALLLAIPFSYVGAFSTTGFSGDFTLGLAGVAYLAVWIVGALYAASRLFNSERILTARFTFRRKKAKQAQA